MKLQQLILRDADRCVLCGMCLPHCPTYVRSGNEAESPRGRISLMLALARGQLEPSDALLRHLDACLACRACETKCPSEVRYGQLLGNTRRLVASQRRPALRARLLAGLTSRPGLLRRALALARSGAGRLVLRLFRLEHAASLAAPRAHPTPISLHATASRGQVALFTGCTGEAFDAETLHAARVLLAAAGYEVKIPEQQQCCGALHHNLGDRAGFERRARANLAAFDPEAVEAIVFIASGCGAMLREYAEWLPQEGAAAFAARCMEITDFLASRGFPADTRFSALAETVAVHIPCTQANVLKAGSAAERLLRLVPQLRPVALPHNNVCCGASGSHMVLHAKTALALREPKLQALAQSGARYLVTTNVGCALHLAAGVREQGQQAEVVHPVTLLARQLAPALAAGAVSH